MVGVFRMVENKEIGKDILVKYKNRILKDEKEQIALDITADSKEYESVILFFSFDIVNCFPLLSGVAASLIKSGDSHLLFSLHNIQLLFQCILKNL